MKHLKTYKQLIESTSAGSQETSGVMPFKYTRVYDPRIGYNKVEFMTDLGMIINDLSDNEGKDLLSIIQKVTGSASVDSIDSIRTLDLNSLIKRRL